jgi:hypothetical protein
MNAGSDPNNNCPVTTPTTAATIIGIISPVAAPSPSRTSRANNDPPMGALNVEAIPAATPATTNVRSSFG